MKGQTATFVKLISPPVDARQGQAATEGESSGGRSVLPPGIVRRMAAESHIEALPIRRALRSRPGGVFGILLSGSPRWLGHQRRQVAGDFYNNFLSGSRTALVYGLIAIGYSLVYGILELINFAHGDMFMLGWIMATTRRSAVLGLTAGSAWYVLWPGSCSLLLDRDGASAAR